LVQNSFLDWISRLKIALEVHSGGRIQILPPFERVKSGGFGRVLQCKYSSLSGSFFDLRAVKVVPLEHLIRDEGEFLYSCKDCPYVVKFYDALELKDFGAKVFIMDWMEHGDLSTLLDQISKSHTTDRLYITSELFLKFSFQILEGLHFLHSLRKKPLLHRDIKPANILVHCKTPKFDLSEVELKLSDFGLSKEFSPGERGSSRGKTAGTTRYKCPECFEPFHNPCPADDTWSAALVLVEMLCGFPVETKGKHIMQWSEAHVEKVREDKVYEHCHPWLRSFVEPVLSALRPDPKRRCTDAKKLLSSLQKFNEHRESMHDVFICHDFQNVEFAERLEDELSEAGFKVYRPSIGIEVYGWCKQLLDKTANVAGVFAEGALRCLHSQIVSELSSRLSEDEKMLLSISGTKYDGGDVSLDLSIDAEPVTRVHRRIIELVFKHLNHKGKTKNVNMQKIVLEGGWLEIGKLCSGSMGDHESVIKMEAITDCDVGFVFNVLKNVHGVPKSVQSAAKELSELRNSIIGHHKLKLRGECDLGTFDTVSDAAKQFTTELRNNSIFDEQLKSLFDRHLVFIETVIRDKESRIKNHLVNSVSILLQSRLIVPIISDYSAERWLSKKSEEYCRCEVLLFCSIAVAGLQVSRRCQSAFSRIFKVQPVLWSSKVQELTQLLKVTDKKCHIPENLFESDSPLFRGILSNIESDTHCEKNVLEIVNDTIYCRDEHMLFPRQYICFFGAEQSRKEHPKFNIGYFVCETDFDSTKFKISLTLDGPTISLFPFAFSIKFKPVSIQREFKYFVSRPVSEVWSEVQGAITDSRINNTAEAARLTASRLGHHFSESVTPSVHAPRKFCRFQIIQRFQKHADSSGSVKSSIFISPSEDIVRVKVKKDLSVRESEDPQVGMKLHSRDEGGYIGLIVWVKPLDDEAGINESLFLLDIVAAKSVFSFVREKMVCCFCSPSCEQGSNFEIYKSVLQGYEQELSQTVQKIHEASKSDDDSSKKSVASLCSRIPTLKIEQHRCLHESFFIGMSDEAIDLWHDQQSRVYNCQLSIKRSLQHIQNLLDGIQWKVLHVHLKESEIVVTECCERFEGSIHEIDAMIMSRDMRVSAGWHLRVQRFLDEIQVEVSSRHNVNDFPARVAALENRPDRSKSLNELLKRFKILSDAESYDPKDGTYQICKRQISLFDAIKCKFEDEKVAFLQIQREAPSGDVLMVYHQKMKDTLHNLLIAHCFTDSLVQIIKDFNARYWTKALIPVWITDVTKLVTCDGKTRICFEGPVYKENAEVCRVLAIIESNNQAIETCKKGLQDLLLESPGAEKSVKMGERYQKLQMDLERFQTIYSRKGGLKADLKTAEDVVIKQMSESWVQPIRDFNKKLAANCPVDQDSLLAPPLRNDRGSTIPVVVDQNAMQENIIVIQQPSPYCSLHASVIASAIRDIGAAYTCYETSFISEGVDGLMLEIFADLPVTEVLEYISGDNLKVKRGLHCMRVFAELKKFWQPPRPTSLTALSSFSVAASICEAPNFKKYQQIFIDNGFDGTMLYALANVSDEEVLKILEIDLGIAQAIHRFKIRAKLKEIRTSYTENHGHIARP
jgi:serine/threonine protein kinase